MYVGRVGRGPESSLRVHPGLKILAEYPRLPNSSRMPTRLFWQGLAPIPENLPVTERLYYLLKIGPSPIKFVFLLSCDLPSLAQGT